MAATASTSTLPIVAPPATSSPHAEFDTSRSPSLASDEDSLHAMDKLSLEPQREAEGDEEESYEEDICLRKREYSASIREYTISKCQVALDNFHRLHPPSNGRQSIE